VVLQRPVEVDHYGDPAGFGHDSKLGVGRLCGTFCRIQGSCSAWIGGAGEADAFYDAFARDHFGMPDSAGLTKAWQTLAAVDWDLSALKTACWVDGDSLAKARAEAVEALGLRARGHLASLADTRRLLAELRPTVRKNHLSWQAAERSAAILEYVLRHLLEAPIIDTANAEGRDRLRKLDERCVELMRWIESDWDRNRYADDPEKGDASRTGQNLLHRFRRMHEYHRALLAGSVSTE